VNTSIDTRAFAPVARLAASLALALAATGSAVAVSYEAPEVKVYSGHYAVGSDNFTTLASLESWLEHVNASAVRLDDCNPPGSSKALVAAVERFHGRFPHALEVHTYGPADTNCSSNGYINPGEYILLDSEGRSLIP
jgi:hypothetical protein